MKCNLTQAQMTLTDRIAIETGICYKDSFRKIALFCIAIQPPFHMKLRKTEPFFPAAIFSEKTAILSASAKSSISAETVNAL